MNNPVAVSIVVPVYRSESTLPRLMERLAPAVERLGDGTEVILVCDGSPDASWEVICGLREKFSFLRGINLMRNYGQHNALLAGILAARGEILVTLDDDLQNPPEQIPNLVEALTPDLDLVYGARSQEQHGFFRNHCSKLVKTLVCIALQVPSATAITSFRAFRSSLVVAFQNQQNPHVFVDAILFWGTSRVASFPVEHFKRTSGSSNYSFTKLLTHAINLVTSFSTVPLRMASLLESLKRRSRSL